VRGSGDEDRAAGEIHLHVGALHLPEVRPGLRLPTPQIGGECRRVRRCRAASETGLWNGLPAVKASSDGNAGGPSAYWLVPIRKSSGYGARNRKSGESWGAALPGVGGPWGRHAAPAPPRDRAVPYPGAGPRAGLSRPASRCQDCGSGPDRSLPAPAHVGLEQADRRAFSVEGALPNGPSGRDATMLGEGPNDG
jgi:hypothetical protein